MGTIGLVFDTLSQGLTDALYSPFVESSLYSRDALQELANELNIPETPVDTHVSLRNRLRGSWDTHQHGGTEFTMSRQLELAGFSGATFERDLETGSPYDFYVRFPSSTFGITSEGPILGTFNLGDANSILGPTELLWEQIYSVQKIVLHFKPSRYRCSALIIEYGSGDFHIVPVQRTGITSDIISASIVTEAGDSLTTESGDQLIT
jgi:hypothetical protein